MISDSNLISDIKAKWQRRLPNSERSSKPTTEDNLKGLGHILSVKNIIIYSRKMAETSAKLREIIKAQY